MTEHRFFLDTKILLYWEQRTTPELDPMKNRKGENNQVSIEIRFRLNF